MIESCGGLLPRSTHDGESILLVCWVELNSLGLALCGGDDADLENGKGWVELLRGSADDDHGGMPKGCLQERFWFLGWSYVGKEYFLPHNSLL